MLEQIKCLEKQKQEELTKVQIFELKLDEINGLKIEMDNVISSLVPDENSEKVSSFSESVYLLKRVLVEQNKKINKYKTKLKHFAEKYQHDHFKDRLLSLMKQFLSE